VRGTLQGTELINTEMLGAPGMTKSAEDPWFQQALPGQNSIRGKQALLTSNREGVLVGASGFGVTISKDGGKTWHQAFSVPQAVTESTNMLEGCALQRNSETEFHLPNTEDEAYNDDGLFCLKCEASHKRQADGSCTPCNVRPRNADGTCPSNGPSNGAVESTPVATPIDSDFPPWGTALRGVNSDDAALINRSTTAPDDSISAMQDADAMAVAQEALKHLQETLARDRQTIAEHPHDKPVRQEAIQDLEKSMAALRQLQESLAEEQEPNPTPARDVRSANYDELPHWEPTVNKVTFGTAPTPARDVRSANYDTPSATDAAALLPVDIFPNVREDDEAR